MVHLVAAQHTILATRCSTRFKTSWTAGLYIGSPKCCGITAPAACPALHHCTTAPLHHCTTAPPPHRCCSCSEPVPGLCTGLRLSCLSIGQHPDTGWGDWGGSQRLNEREPCSSEKCLVDPMLNRGCFDDNRVDSTSKLSNSTISPHWASAELLSSRTMKHRVLVMWLNVLSLITPVQK